MKQKVDVDKWPWPSPPPGSPFILDNLGLVISLGILEKQPEYHAALRAYFGSSWRLHRWWMKQIMRRLKKEEMAQRRARFALARLALQQEYLNAVIEVVQERDDKK